MMADKLRAAFVLEAIILVLLSLLAGCAPMPFVAGREVGTPAGCVEARERGHEC